MSYENNDFKLKTEKVPKSGEQIIGDVLASVPSVEKSSEQLDMVPRNPDKEDNRWPAQHEPRKGEPDNVEWLPKKVDIPTPERRTME